MADVRLTHPEASALCVIARALPSPSDALLELLQRIERDLGDEAMTVAEAGRYTALLEVDRTPRERRASR